MMMPLLMRLVSGNVVGGRRVGRRNVVGELVGGNVVGGSAVGGLVGGKTVGGTVVGGLVDDVTGGEVSLRQRGRWYSVRWVGSCNVVGELAGDNVVGGAAAAG